MKKALQRKEQTRGDGFFACPARPVGGVTFLAAKPVTRNKPIEKWGLKCSATFNLRPY